LGAGDLEVEGSEQFVAQYQSALSELIDRLKSQPRPAAGGETAGRSSPASTVSEAGEPREFGEVLHSLPNGASGSDKILLAGSYVQRTDSNNSFSTGEANQLLLGQGVKLSNPSQALKNAIEAKRAFKVGSRYRVSKVGEDHLKSLTG
jgi:hypothetical protein